MSEDLHAWVHTRKRQDSLSGQTRARISAHSTGTLESSPTPSELASRVVRRSQTPSACNTLGSDHLEGVGAQSILVMCCGCQTVRISLCCCFRRSDGGRNGDRSRYVAGSNRTPLHRKKLVCYLGKTGVPNKHRVCYCISLTH